VDVTTIAPPAVLVDDRARDLLERDPGDVELGARADGHIAEREIGRLEPEPQRVELGIDPHTDEVGNDRVRVRPRRDRDAADDENHGEHTEQDPASEERRQRRWLATRVRRTCAPAFDDVRWIRVRRAHPWSPLSENDQSATSLVASRGTRPGGQPVIGAG
jgi:hypothetical protein